MTFLSMCFASDVYCFSQSENNLYWQYHPGIFSQENLNSSKQNFNFWINDTLNKLEIIQSTNFSNLDYKIPTITHVVYLSHNKHTKIGELEERKIIESSMRYSRAEPLFKHYFWTNNPDLVTEKMMEIPNFQVRNINEFSEHRLWGNFVYFMEISKTYQGYLAQASDIGRIMITQEHGGIYRDADYSTFKNVQIILNSMKLFTYINGKEFEWDNSFVGNAFMASAAHDPVIVVQEEFIYRNLNSKEGNLPLYIQNPATLVDAVLFSTGPVAITMGLEKVIQTNVSHNENVMIFPSHVVYNYNMARADSPEKKYVDFDGNYTECSNFFDINLCAAGGDPFGGSWTRALGDRAEIFDNPYYI